jgi:AraC-like DNA-binding protein
LRTPRAKVDHILPLFPSLIDLIIARHMIAILGRHPLDPIFARMTERPEEMLGKSMNRTAHLFAEGYGKSFKVLQKEIRMKKATELLTASKGAGIREIAARCG